MKWTKRSVIELIAILLMAGVVFLLATLQYRWTAEISGTEQDRLESALDTSVRNFDQEFSYDFERLCEGFEIDPDEPVATLETRILRQYTSWTHTTKQPGFLLGIYVWKTGETSDRALESLNLDNNRFQQVDWPAELDSLHQFLTRQSAQISPMMPDRKAVYYPWTFYEEGPALVRPIFRSSLGASASEMVVQPVGFLIVELSGSFLKQAYLPELVDHYFVKLGFAAAIRSAEPPYQAVYLSDPQFPVATSSPDAVVNLFDSVAEEARRRGHPPVEPSSVARQWQLVVQHPLGSLETAVASWRRRNLAISFGLLFILAGSVVLVFSVARRAERFAKLQMEFVAGVSHELCTPLAVINSAVENLADGVVDNPGQVQEYAGILRDQGGRLERLLDQVLLFASGKLSRSEYELRPIEIGAVVAQSVAASERMLLDAGFTVEKNISDHLPPVIADPAVVNKCVENLISNTMKYAGENHWIGIRARPDSPNSPEEVLVSVQDRGIGIPASDLPHIFEPFYRVQAARDGQIRGVGLGLHLVKRMMEEMGGSIDVSSEIGKGTCFTLHFPLPKNANHRNGEQT
jgi:signal transduction histidine kinase